MRKFQNFLKTCRLIFQFIKCMTCAHKNNCEHSLYVDYKGVKYFITAKVVKDNSKQNSKVGDSNVD